ncbi:hypothetical protein EZV62_024377 [Acer yangbiense]|uniref:DUF4283 domain-containing protein n=1 Tax=Acer yangbiense TaxID=1000413 RepID=A0A5C7GVZ9_9ROSI|nr:hypothetical protein EZV62_024377 [Acer yangbiense]
MNADDLAMLCSALSVKEKEQPVRVLNTKLKDQGARKLSLCLVGKIFTSKLVNRAAFIDVMLSVWRVNEGVDIEWADGNIFVLHFKNLEDRSRIISGGPWNFDRAIILFEEPSGDGDIMSMRECTETGDIREVTSEASLRLNVWLRTGKNQAVEDASSGDQWRKKCQASDQRKIEGRIGAKHGCMGTEKEIINSDKKVLNKEKNSGGVIIDSGEKQKELIRGEDSRSVCAPGGMEILNDSTQSHEMEISVDHLYHIGPAQDGPPIKLVVEEPMRDAENINNDSRGPDPCPKSNSSRPTTLKQKPIRWKRIAREKKPIEKDSDLGERKIRLKNVESVSNEVLEFSRKRYGESEIESGSIDCKKKKAESGLEIGNVNKIVGSFAFISSSEDSLSGLEIVSNVHGDNDEVKVLERQGSKEEKTGDDDDDSDE